MSEISLHKDSFKCGVIYNMSTVDVYAPPRVTAISVLSL